jgi:hypothetical protein
MLPPIPSGEQPSDLGDGPLFDLLARLAAAGVEPVRHGGFLGFRNPGRLTPDLWAAFRAAEPRLIHLLPSRPTPYRERLRGGARA